MQRNLAVLWVGWVCACGSVPSTDMVTDARPVDAPDRRLNSPGSVALLEQLRAMSPRNERQYLDAIAAGVQFIPTGDEASFYAFWQPPGWDPERHGFVVSLHGHDGFVASSFEAWRPFLTARGYGLLALQWWFGGGETILDYYLPDEMYPEISAGLDAHAIPAGKLLFEGFSRGSANSYAMTAIDQDRADPRFLLTVAAAGQAVLDYPPTADIANGVHGPTPFANTHWVTYCGELDTTVPDPCGVMRASADWVASLGGVIELSIEDPTGPHGGFHLEHNANQALEIYDQLRAR